MKLNASKKVMKLKNILGVLILTQGLLSTPTMAGTVTTIPHGVGLYVSPNGLDYFANQGVSFARWHNVDLSRQNLGNKHHETGEKTVDEFLPDNPKLTGLIKQAKAQFAKFFRSREIVFKNKHNFVVDVKNIDVRMDWGKVGFEFLNDHQGTYVPQTLTLNLILNNIQIKIDKIDLKDKMHTFLETVGVDNVKFGFDSASVPLTFSVPVSITVNNGLFGFSVNKPYTNLDQIKLALDYKKPMRLPKVEIIVNGTRAVTRLDEIETLLRNKRTDLLEGLKKAALEYLNGDFGPTVSKVLTEKSNAKFATWESMEPLGAPNTYVPKMNYRFVPGGIGFKDSNLHFFLNAKIKDTVYTTTPGLDDRQTATLGVQSRTLNKHAFDVAISLNEGVINQFLNLSDRRGYYDYITTSSGEKYELVERPVMDFGGRPGGSSGLHPIVKLKIKYNVTGVKKYAVNNPIEVEFNLKLRYPVKNGKVQIVVAGIEEDSVYVARRFAAYEILWPKVLEAAKETLAGMESGLRGMVLSDGIPIPTDVFGFPMTITHAEPDANGHILVFLDYAN